MFEKIKIGEGASKKGKLLVAEPLMQDLNFKRSVVLLTEHNEDGTIGFILNKKIHDNIHQALVDFPDFDAPLFMGGPVQPDTLHYLHTIGDKLEGSIEVTDGIYWGGSYEILKILLESGEIEPDEIRFFIGYSGWDSGQLEDEKKMKSWILSQAFKEDIFYTKSDELWKKVLERMGRDYDMLSNFPEDPTLN